MRCCKRLGPKYRILRALYKGITVAPLPRRYSAPGPEVCARKNTHVYSRLPLDTIIDAISWWLGREWRRFQFRVLQRRIEVLACDARCQYIELHARSFISSLLRVNKTETFALKCAMIQRRWAVIKQVLSMAIGNLARIQENAKSEGKTLVI